MSREVHVRFCEGLGVRFPRATRLVIGFEYESDARACLAALAERFEKFGLRLHPQKTRLIEFGRGSAAKRKREGRGKCETFDFLGFTHICSRTRNGKRFALLRLTIASRMRRTLSAVKQELRRRRHWPIGVVGRWLASVYRGWQGYHGVPNNYRRLEQFRRAVFHLWRGQLRRRSQKGSHWTLERTQRLFERHVPSPHIAHPWPDTRHHALLRARAV